MNQKGAVIVTVAASMFVFIAMASLALDLGHLYVVRNELQNASDAGALAGVSVLYNADGSINFGLVTTATNAAQANHSEKLPVEVIEAEVRIGHWNFATRTFSVPDVIAPMTPQELFSILGPPPYNLSNLDDIDRFINAVQIITRRGGTPGGTPATPFFSRLWGYLGFNLGAVSTAYIGFAQAIEPEAVDTPIAICIQAVMQSGTLNCVTGRMINSNGTGTNTNTGGWTNYSQGEGCSQPSANQMQDILSNCGGGNSTYILPMSTIGISNGMQASTYATRVDSFRNCWKQGKNDLDEDGVAETPLAIDPITGYPIQSWKLKFPLIDCGDDYGPINGCRENVVVLGTIDMEVVWISQVGSDPDYSDIPTKMDDWSCTGTDIPSRIACWNSFVNHFQITNYNDVGGPAPYLGMSIYVKPMCQQHVGTNSGPMLFSFFNQRPVLVN